MKKSISHTLVAGFITLLALNLAFAQKKTTILGDTWTGTVTAVDENSRAITIKYEKKEKIETFTGILSPGYKLKMKDGGTRELELSQITIGIRVRMFVKTREQKENGNKTKVNLISGLDFLGIDEFWRLREVLNMKSLAAVNLAASDKLPAGVPLKVYFVSDLPQIKDSFIDWVSKWNKEQGAKHGSLESVSDLAQADFALVAHLGSDNMEMPAFDLYDGNGNAYRVKLRHVTTYLVVNSSTELRVLWKQVLLVGSSTRGLDRVEHVLEDQVAKRMKARTKN